MKEMTEDDLKSSEIAQTLYLLCVDKITEKFPGRLPSKLSQIMFTIFSGCIFNFVLNLCGEESDKELDNAVKMIKKHFSADFDTFIKRYKELKDK